MCWAQSLAGSHQKPCSGPGDFGGTTRLPTVHEVNAGLGLGSWEAAFPWWGVRNRLERLCPFALRSEEGLPQGGGRNWGLARPGREHSASASEMSFFSGVPSTPASRFKTAEAGGASSGPPGIPEGLQPAIPSGAPSRTSPSEQAGFRVTKST